MVAAHRERIAGGTECARVCDGDEGQEGCDREQQRADFAQTCVCGRGDRCQVAGQDIGWNEADHRDGTQTVNQDRRAKGEKDADGQVAFGVGDFLGQAGDVGDADVADVDESRGRQQGFRPDVVDAGEVREVELGKAPADEITEQGKQSQDEEDLK